LNESSSSRKEYNLFQYTSNGSDIFTNIKNKKNERENQIESATSPSSDDVVKYRGVAVSQPVTQATITSQANQSITANRKPRTYRGVAY